jgi:hypothetical protein
MEIYTKFTLTVEILHGNLHAPLKFSRNLYGNFLVEILAKFIPTVEICWKFTQTVEIYIKFTLE